MSQKGSITPFQVYFLFISTIGILNHVIILPKLLDLAERDSWVAVLFSIPIYIPIVWCIFYITKKTKQQNIIQWIQAHYNRLTAWLIVLLILINLYISLYISLKDTITWTSTSYLPKTPDILIALIVLTLCYFTAIKGIETIVIVNGIILPFTLIFGDFIAIGNLPQKDFSILFPVFQSGMKPYYDGIISQMTGMIEMVLLLFLQHYLKLKVRLIPLLITGLVLTFLTLGPTIGALTEFGPIIASQLRYPAFEQWRLLTLTRIIEHLDFLSVYQWWTGSYMRISLALFLLIDVLQLRSQQKKRWTLFWICFSLILIIRIPESDIDFWQITSIYLLPFSLISFSLILLILIALVFIGSFKKNKGDANVLSTTSENHSQT